MIQILRNEYASRVAQDLVTIANDPILEIAPESGIVFYPFATVPGIGPSTVYLLANSTSFFVGIQGQSSDFSAVPKSGYALREIGGFTTADDPLEPRQIEIVYDVPSCGGRGAVVEGKAEGQPVQIDMPTHVLLFHELRHAVHMVAKRFTFDAGVNEAMAILDENEYRRQAVPALPERGGPAGGCKQVTGFWDAYKEAGGGGGGSGCFVATAAYGSPLDANVAVLRRFRDEIIRATRFGENFWQRYRERYQRLSPTIVGMMARDPELRELVRWSIVEPIVNHVEVALSFPDAPLDGVPEPWASWLRGRRERLAQWLGAIELPTDFEGLGPDEAVAELRILLRHVLHTSAARDEYIARLRDRGALPLRVDGATYERLARQLRDSPATAERLDLLLVRMPPTPCAYGHDHVFTDIQPDFGDYDYTVFVTNGTSDTYTAVVLYYSTSNVPATRQASVQQVLPGDVCIFSLGPTRFVERYNVGCFVGEELLVTYPETGGFVPGDPRAQDAFQSVDAWVIVPGPPIV